MFLQAFNMGFETSASIWILMGTDWRVRSTACDYSLRRCTYLPCKLRTQWEVHPRRAMAVDRSRVGVDKLM